MTRPRAEAAITAAGVVVTCLAAVMTAWHLIAQGAALARGDTAKVVEVIAFGVFFAGLVYGSLVYQFCRIGYFRRLDRYAPSARETLEAVHDGPARALAVLIPSYKEELTVIAQTTLSAAFMEHPNRRITVLLDDPLTGGSADLQALAASRSLIEDLDRTFAAGAEPFALELQAFQRRRSQADLATEARRLAWLYHRAAWWVDGFAARFAGADGSADRFFVDSVIRRSSAQHRARARLLPTGPMTLEAVEREYRRLASLFAVRIASFERKRYAELSHAANKAMNLNAYIGLMGGAYTQSESPRGLVLTPCDPRDADLVVAPADYLLTLDADSLVLSEYALELVAIMEADDRVAVAQTPYSAFPGAPGALERTAGATTDMQYVVHQGATAFNAAYWVGANALLRYAALTDIRTIGVEGGREVPVFIQDRTVIEDTGSTVDLISRGWRLHNHPMRLAYSATPPDFGALAIQRGRWANGGLIILPDLLRHCARGAGRRPSVAEALLRIHYLVSPAISSVALLALLLIRFDSGLVSWWLPFSAAPYYIVYGRDLKRHGYRWVDLVSVYALNLVLLPVNLAGVFGSLRQMATGRKAPFARTPKVDDRTATPPAFVAFLLAATLFMAGASIIDAFDGAWTHAAFSALNAALLAYGYTKFVGWRESAIDVMVSLRPRGAALATKAAPLAATGLILASRSAEEAAGMSTAA